MQIELEHENRYLEVVRSIVDEAVSSLHCKVFLFGSRARGNYRRGSDFDIGISGLGEAAFIKVRNRILEQVEESIAPYGVDIVNLDAVESAFKEEALRGAVVWKQG